MAHPSELKMMSCQWLLACGICSSLLQAAAATTIVDMSHEYRTGETLSWLTATPFQLTLAFEGVPEGAEYYYYMNYFTTSEHSGTHIDAPRHFARDRWTTEQIPLDVLVNIPVYVVDVSEKVKFNSSYLLSTADLTDWETAHGQLPDSPYVLLVNCGWAQRWPNKLAYFGTETNDTSKVIFPSLSEAAIRWVLAHRGRVVGVGLDTPSVDYGTTTTVMVHRLLSARNVYILENVNNVRLLPPTGARLSVLPMKIAGGSGAPARMFATVDEGTAAPYSVDTLEPSGGGVPLQHGPVTPPPPPLSSRYPRKTVPSNGMPP